MNPNPKFAALAFMLGMYKNAKANLGIFAGSALIFAVALWLVRSEATVEEVSWMKAMIPAPFHRHSHERAGEDPPIHGCGSWPTGLSTRMPGNRRDEGVDRGPRKQGK